ncbi:anti-sigma regulatory factor (Ser/Thr protein kinase) [Kitasatospora gansuensis]|uniref:Anti-sigma regulatory factor (Ser/Thr protein kinase) n=1 Tax=Kitasatospora gansuensis TaxID=258050 RepID=A0A7W7SK04_9ACTN|nr:ATP-binding protein [Kitasatospora gansuensis]MBB4951308.1 anti-sigma regulatory factor (Ser/Thr protein kinase) [Kitasatospora gansuensis]
MLATTTAPTAAVGRRRTSACTMPAVPTSVPALRHFARTSARHWDVAVDTVEALALVVTELVTNAVRHSGGPDVTLLLTVDTGTLTVHVMDNGRWRPRPALRDLVDDPACGGRGLRLVEEYADSCALWRTVAGTRVEVGLSLAQVSATPTPDHVY